MRASAFSTHDWVGLGVAAYAAVLSTALAMRQIWRDRPGIKVLVVALAAQSVDNEDEWRDYWWVRVINVRQRPIELTRIGFHMQRRVARNLLAERVAIRGAESTRLPVSLKDGDKATFYFEREGHGHGGLGKLKAVWVEDSLDRRYMGRYRANSLKQLVLRIRLWSYRRRGDRRRTRRR